MKKIIVFRLDELLKEKEEFIGMDMAEALSDCLVDFDILIMSDTDDFGQLFAQAAGPFYMTRLTVEKLEHLFLANQKIFYRYIVENGWTMQ